MTTSYIGRRKPDGSCEILADGKKLSLKRSLSVSNHSPTGFEWGYGGSGPAQSALAILLDFTHGKRDFCERFHNAFKFKFLAGAARHGWEITGEQILAFIETMKEEEEDEGTRLCESCLCAKYIHSDNGRCWNKGCACGKTKRKEVKSNKV